MEVVPAKMSYPMTGDPPIEVGAIQDNNTSPSPATADWRIGELGTFFTVIWLDGAEGGPVPKAFVAVTLKV